MTWSVLSLATQCLHPVHQCLKKVKRVWTYFRIVVEWEESRVNCMARGERKRAFLQAADDTLKITGYRAKSTRLFAWRLSFGDSYYYRYNTNPTFTASARQGLEHPSHVVSGLKRDVRPSGVGGFVAATTFFPSEFGPGRFVASNHAPPSGRCMAFRLSRVACRTCLWGLIWVAWFSPDYHLPRSRASIVPDESRAMTKIKTQESQFFLIAEGRETGNRTIALNHSTFSSWW